MACFIRVRKFSRVALHALRRDERTFALEYACALALSRHMRIQVWTYLRDETSQMSGFSTKKKKKKKCDEFFSPWTGNVDVLFCIFVFILYFADRKTKIHFIKMTSIFFVLFAESSRGSTNRCKNTTGLQRSGDKTLWRTWNTVCANSEQISWS